MFKRILVATDGSELSRKAVTQAITLARENDAQLVALKVVPRYPKSYFDGAAVFSHEDVARIERQWAEAAQATLAEVARQGQESGVKVLTATAHGDGVAEAIIAAARKHESDLIVMASHGRAGVKRLLLGSETLHVLTHSTLPVLVLR